MLSQEETLFYLRKAQQNDDNAKQILYENNTPLIKSIVKKFINKGVEYNDLYQIACIGFTKALNNFNAEFNVKFSTYIVPMIIGEIKRYMRDNGSIKVSRAVKILANKISHFIADYQVQHDHAPTVKEISEQFNVEEDQVVFALDSAKMPISLFNVADDESEIELIDKISLDNQEEKLLNKIEISTLIEKLTEKEKKVITIRYFKDMTQNETAKILGVSQVQVSRIESKILQKLKSLLKEA